jgi:hypothetical protein
MLLLTTETRRAQRELYFLPDREMAIGQTGNPPEGWDSKRSAEKRSQPYGHDLVTWWHDVNGWSQAKELSPEAEALFPGRRLPAREKTPFSVFSVPLWWIFNQASLGRYNTE